MKRLPDPNMIYPIKDYTDEILIKPTIKNKNVIVGDFSYYAGKDFSECVTHFYEHIGDKLIIGKFCQIASGVRFIMNGANHKMNCATTYPFFTFPDWDAPQPKNDEMPLKGDTKIGNDVWIGQNAVILPGVKVGDGAIIGAEAVVGSDIPSYTIAVGNPARVVKRRFDEELTGLLLKLKWWDLDVEKIKELVPVLTSSDLNKVKKEIKALL